MKFLILATGFSEFKLLHVLYKWPTLYQMPVIAAYATVPSLKTNVGHFFTSVNSKNSDTGKMINLISIQKMVIYSLLHLQVKMIFPFGRVLETDGSGCS